MFSSGGAGALFVATSVLRWMGENAAHFPNLSSLLGP